MLIFRSNALSRERPEERSDERRNARRDSDALRRVIFRTISGDAGDRRLETSADVEGIAGTAVLGGGGG